MTDLLWTRDDRARATLVLAHGAGAPMDASFMTRVAEGLAERGVAVVRFEFAYMAKRRATGRKYPPPKAEKLISEGRAALDAVLAAPECVGPVVIAGKSMGGRVAAMTAGEPLDPRVVAVACLGYPFHGPGRPEEIRLAPLQAARLPVLILQGERDDFGSRAEVETLDVGPATRFEWITDGSHDFGPRGASPATLKSNIAHACDALAAFALGFVDAPAAPPPAPDAPTTDAPVTEGPVTEGPSPAEMTPEVVAGD